jgi:EAL domain-containing protein (putative c-di-GMP-specific phosphodiesterase class I)
MADSILEGLKNKEVVMHYQPIVDLKTLERSSYEALIRWQHPTLGLLYPNKFIEKAEREPDTIFEIFSFGLEAASEAINILKLPVSVNLSVVSLTHKNFPSEIALYQDEPIAFEITERASMESASAKQLERLALVDRLGFTVLVDDFTAASFNHLSAILGAFRDLERVKVKLDMHLIQNLSKPHMKTIIKAIVTCAHEMGIKVICEGIEESEHEGASAAEQVEFLRAIGCDYAQGYYFGKPKAL